MKTKKCSKCKKVKSVLEFCKDNSTKTGLQNWCKSCQNKCRSEFRKTERGKQARREASKKYRNSDAGRKYRQSKNYKIMQKNYAKSDAGKASAKKEKMKHRYGITPKQCQEIYLKQNGCCVICGRPFSYDKIQNDHNHITGKFRGLLCKSCNTRLGWFETRKGRIKQYTKEIQKYIT